VTSVTTIVGVLVMMLSISWMMTLVVLVILPVSFVFISRIIKASQKHFTNQQAYLGHVNGHVEEMYGGHTVMRLSTASKSPSSSSTRSMTSSTCIVEVTVRRRDDDADHDRDESHEPDVIVLHM
jgi:ABC-type multidrug transport system fused ATPase/permease subunit